MPRDTAARQGISEERLIRLDAMGTCGYADEKDIPSILDGLVRDRTVLIVLYRTGLRVLEVCQRVARG
jgi:site-specific recombinase XerD